MAGMKVGTQLVILLNVRPVFVNQNGRFIRLSIGAGAPEAEGGAVLTIRSFFFMCGQFMQFFTPRFIQRAIGTHKVMNAHGVINYAHFSLNLSFCYYVTKFAPLAFSVMSKSLYFLNL